MDEKLKRVIEKLKDDPDYEVKFVHYWADIDTVDSLIYDTYEDAISEYDNIRVMPIIKERDEEDKKLFRQKQRIRDILPG